MLAAHARRPTSAFSPGGLESPCAVEKQHMYIFRGKLGRGFKRCTPKDPVPEGLFCDPIFSKVLNKITSIYAHSLMNKFNTVVSYVVSAFSL